MEMLRVRLEQGDDANKQKCKKKVHVVAVPYPAQGHIVPLMQLCRKLAGEEGVMVTFVNTMHNHARMLQAELAAAGTRGPLYENNFNNMKNVNSTSNYVIGNTCTDSNYNNCTDKTNCNISYTSNCNISTNVKNIHSISKNSNSYTNICMSTSGHLDEDCDINNNIRLVGIPGGLPPELHADPAHIVAAFQASEALCGPLEKLLHKLNQEGPSVTCIISDVLMSWTQECADMICVPRFAFWTSSAAVYHVIWHMYGLISKGLPTFKAGNTIFENNNTEMVSCIPGLPPMDLNDLPIIVRSDPADFIYQFLTRQLKPMERAAAVLLNTFYELEERCLQALPATCTMPIFSIGPLLPPHVTLQANVNGNFDGVFDGFHDMGKSAEPAKACEKAADSELKYKHAGEKRDTKAAGSDGEVDGGNERSTTGGKTDGVLLGEELKGVATKAAEKALLAGGKAICAVGGSSRKAVGYRSSAGIFSEDVSCLEWLDKREPRSVLYISFGSIFAMSVDQFTELAEGLQASKQAFLWSIRPGFVQGTTTYTPSLPRSFLKDTQDRGLLVSWVPQLSVLAHPAIGGFLTHCGWNSTLESVTLGVPMLCWPDVGERRTNGRLAVSVWEAGLEFSCSLQKNGPLISREEVKRVIRLLMEPCSDTAALLRSKAAALQICARQALARSGSSSHDWNLFLDRIQHPN